MNRMLLWSVLFVLVLGAMEAWADTATTFLPEAPTVLLFTNGGMVPLRPIVELTGAKMSAQGGKITVSRGANTVVFTLNSAAAIRNGKKIALPTPPGVSSGITYVPVRTIVTALGGTLVAGETPDTFIACFPGMDPLTLPVEQVNSTLARCVKIDSELYLARLDGSDVRQLTYNTASDINPCFSPDGSAMVFGRFNGETITVMHRTGERPVATDLTAGATAAGTICVWPVPDSGNTVLITQIKDLESLMGAPDLCRVSTMGGGLQRLRPGICPLISADGQSIFYAGEGDDTEIIYARVMRRDGSDDRVLGEGLPMAVNSQNNTLVYVTPSETDNGPFLLTAVDPATGQVLFSTDKQDKIGEGPFCDFSPDGAKFVYMRENHGIWIADADHSHARQLTSNPEDICPRFSPDGTRIAFIRNGFLHVMHADGSAITCLAPNHPFSALFILNTPFHFSPDGSAIIFAGITKKGAAARLRLFGL